ncbi:MAG: trypsin-like peptidase domain-containing protein [Dechloromonas sp.]|nr:trypsin-like peptidase domain-containing protein [Dechloromonas sp.]
MPRRKPSGLTAVSPPLHQTRCVLLLAALALLPGRSALAAQDSELQPLAADSALAGKLGAVGIVVSGEPGSAISMATGFLISACHVLTAGHVLARTGQSARIGIPVKFIPKGESGRASLPAVWGRVVAADPDFVMSEGPPGFDLQAIARDWGLIELDHPLAGVEPIKLVFPGSRLARDALFSIVGYPLGSRQIGLYAHEHCRNWAGHHGSAGLTNVVFADCAVRQGMSGGPLLVDDSETPLAAGIVVKRVVFSQKIMAVAVPSHVFAKKIEAAMRDSEVCAAGSPFALPSYRAQLDDLTR